MARRLAVDESRLLGRIVSIQRVNPKIPSARLASTESIASTSFSSLQETTPRRPLVRTTFLALTLFGIATTAVGVYTYYNTFSTWPEEVRGDLRAAIRAHKRGDAKPAERLYKSALLAAQSMDMDKLGTQPLLKLSGISIALGSFLEEEGRLVEAYEVYASALKDMKARASTAEERLRTVALAQKCGDLAAIKEVESAIPMGSISSADEQVHSLAEEHLRWSVEELLRLAIPEAEREQILSSSADGKGDQETGAVVLADLDLPPWISGSTLGASLEALGQLYASQGRSEYAIPLYVQSINMLMPANKASRKRDPTVAERCRTGILMNNVAQLLVDVDTQGMKREEATSWALKGLDIVAFALRGTGWDGKPGQGFKTVQSSSKDEARTKEVKSLCFTAEVALLLNLAELARLGQDECKARDLFQRVYRKADAYGMRDARSRAAQALSELERVSSRSKR